MRPGSKDGLAIDGPTGPVPPGLETEQKQGWRG